MALAHIPGCSQNHRPRQRCDGPVADQQRAAMQAPIEVRWNNSVGGSDNAPRNVTGSILRALATLQVALVAVTFFLMATTNCHGQDRCNAAGGVVVLWFVGELVLVPATLLMVIIDSIRHPSRTDR